MIRFEIVRCIKPFDEAFQRGKLYKAYPNKSGHHQVFVGDERHLVRPGRVFAISERHFFLEFFTPVGHLFLPNSHVCQEVQNKSIEDILAMMKKEAETKEG